MVDTSRSHDDHALGPLSTATSPAQRWRPAWLCAPTTAATASLQAEHALTAKRQSPELAEYRRHCVDAGQKAQEDFDKSVLSLSGGALGVSFAFLKDVIGPGPVRGSVWLVAAWTVWAVSIVAVLSSFFFSQLALRTAITQVDDATIHTQDPGRWYTRATMGLNIAAGLLFLAGVIAMMVFVRTNFLVPNVAP